MEHSRGVNTREGYAFSFLKIALCVQMLAQAYNIFRYSSPINTFIFITLDLSEQLAYSIEKLLVGALVVSSLALWSRFRPVRLVAGTVGLSVAMLLSLTIFVSAASFGHQLVWLAHLARMALPLGLILSEFRFNRRLLPGVLTVGIAGTFLGHGIEAWQLHPTFIDYLIETAEDIFAYPLQESQAEVMLKMIGLIDIAVALLAVFFKQRAVYIYLVGWGLITAFARIISYDFEVGAGEFFLRSSHILVPLYLALITRHFSLKKNNSYKEVTV